MAFSPSPTTGIGVAANILTTGNINAGNTKPGYNGVVLSISAANSRPEVWQLSPDIVDAAGTPVALGTVYVNASVANAAAQFTETLSAVAASVNGTAAYTTSSTPVAGSLVGQSFIVTGFSGANNNGTFICTANTTTIITLENPAATVESASASAASTPKVATYTGTFTGATTGSLVGKTVVIAGFVTNAVNNGVFEIVANTGTSTITVTNPAAISESATSSVTVQESGTSLCTYVAYGAKSLKSGTAGQLPASSSATPVATVSATGLITAVTPGETTVEVSFPTFNNAVGDIVSSGNVMNGLPINKIYSEVNVFVIP